MQLLIQANIVFLNLVLTKIWFRFIQYLMFGQRRVSNTCCLIGLILSSNKLEGLSCIIIMNMKHTFSFILKKRDILIIVIFQ